jgi:hypothetical protein
MTIIERLRKVMEEQPQTEMRLVPLELLNEIIEEIETLECQLEGALWSQ